MSRRKGRYVRRQAKRIANRIKRSQEVGGLKEVFSYDRLFKAGKACCNGVRWKTSTQNFELHLFSGTARRRKDLITHKWKPGKYVHFTISERGKIREIDAPRIQDRQVEKVFTKDVLLKLYRPSMIYNNGASLKGKGFDFSKRELRNDLHWHYRRYGTEGRIILVDFKQFFPSVSHDEIYKRHRQLMLNLEVRQLGDTIVKTSGGDYGMPLGVEPSQAEMIAFPSALDNFIKCQLSMKCAGHYMDDYYVIVPPNLDAKEILEMIIAKVEGLKLTVNRSKTRIVPLTKPFKYCKAKYRLTETGRVVVTCNRKSVMIARRKIKSFQGKLERKEVSYEDIWTSVNATMSYLGGYNDHKRLLRLRRLFYAIYGFSCENIENFRRKERNEICVSPSVQGENPFWGSEYSSDDAVRGN